MHQKMLQNPLGTCNSRSVSKDNFSMDLQRLSTVPRTSHHPMIIDAVRSWLASAVHTSVVILQTLSKPHEELACLAQQFTVASLGDREQANKASGRLQQTRGSKASSWLLGMCGAAAS
jgi:hypothetical protein